MCHSRRRPRPLSRLGFCNPGGQELMGMAVCRVGVHPFQKYLGSVVPA